MATINNFVLPYYNIGVATFTEGGEPSNFLLNTLNTHSISLKSDYYYGNQ